MIRTMDLEDKDGNLVKAAVISDPTGSAAQRFLYIMGRMGKANKTDSVGRVVSSQIDAIDGMRDYYDMNAVVEPPVLPHFYTALYLRDATMRASVDALVEAVVKQGWHIRPRQEIWPVSTAGRTPSKASSPHPDESKRDEIVAVLEAGLPEYSFSEMLAAMFQDYYCTGNAYMELMRDAQGRLAKMADAKSVTMRIAKNVPGFVQVKGSRKQWFVKYGVEDARAIRLVRRDTADFQLDGKAVMPRLPVFIPAEDGEGAFIAKADIRDGYWYGSIFDWMKKAQKDGDEIQVPVHEMMHFAIRSPRDTVYGEPPIISAIEDYLGAQNARLFMLSYFDNATVPRLAIFIKGEGGLNRKVLSTIDEWIKTQNKLDALNQVLVLEIGEETDIQIERLSSEHLSDSGGYLQFREDADRGVLRAYRVPPPVVFNTRDLNRATSQEMDRRFLEYVVRPEQRVIEQRFNYIFEREFGTRDWVLDLEVPDLLDLQEKRELWDMLLSRGAASINEIRAELHMPRLPGGDEPILYIAGQGYTPLSAFVSPQKVKETIESSRKQMVSGNMKTPPRGVPTEKAAVVVAEKPSTLPPDAQQTMATILEDLGVANPDDIQKAFPEAFTPAVDNNGASEETEVVTLT